MKTRLTRFAFEVFKGLEAPLSCKNKRFLLAISGGLDSMALFPLFRELQERIGFEIMVCHVHHGLNASDEQLEFRRSAQEKVRQVSEEHAWKFVTNDPEKGVLDDSSDEADLREYRFKKIDIWMKEFDCDFLVTAHHADDLIETRLIRLIRGTGSQGLRSMSKKDGFILRPFLHHQRERVALYAKNNGVLAVEDPENSNPRFLRSWIRNHWLKDLEQYRPGARQTLARSIETLVGEFGCSAKDRSVEFFESSDEGRLVIRRDVFRGEAAVDPLTVLRDYFWKCTGEGLSSNQLEEIEKRLNTERKQFAFSVGRREWQVNAEQVWVMPCSEHLSGAMVHKSES